ncbi:serine hydrolase domain-containing protein [Sphingomonas cavernae]|uniref:Class A beta-lactamase-related serine hydrolase n=1 Tax=Sphingomonas cavernae TaxID=2320861 RepID=A0A418W7D2_9SPHN|nr:serine hydrolase domain-containing protein [Sphingomonas cavernae]RJF85956.1 class A beta-lactamase-related serine hydrolase [Sphingomonas cavernae]
MLKVKPLHILFAATLIAAPVQAATVGKVKEIISDPKALAAPGCAVGAFRDGKTIFTAVAGAADIASGKPINGDTLFYAASISKQFTALAAAKLVEQGKLGLDDDVRKYLPELPQYEAPVTVRMLMLHTAGIRDSLELIRLSGIESAADTDKDTALRLLFGQKSTNYASGTAYTYSNGGYLLLAEIVERVAGMPFADYARKAILQPLGMKRSFFMNDAGPTGANIAHGYVPVGDGFEIRDTYPRFSGSGGLMITINDLARYERDLAAGHKVWTASVRKIMLTPGTLTNGRPVLVEPTKLAYGGGLLIGPRNGQNFVMHTGGAEGFRNIYARLPDRQLAVAVFCNRGDWASEKKADAIIEAIEGDILIDEPKAAAMDLEGRYVSDELQATYDLSLAGDELTAKMSSPYAAEKSILAFKRNADGSFGTTGMRLLFDEDRQGFTIKTARVHALHFRRVG